MIKEELSVEERRRISSLGGQGRRKALSAKEREEQARDAANMRHHGTKKPGTKKVPASASV